MGRHQAVPAEQGHLRAAPWRDLPENFGPYTSCYNRFVRWRRTGVWDQLMNALTARYDAAVQMIDTSVVRVHQHGACIAANSEQLRCSWAGQREAEPLSSSC
jgi:transposase